MTTTSTTPTPGWGSLGQHLDVSGRVSNVDRVSDHAAVLETIHRYGMSYDERQIEDLGDTFTEDGTFHGFVNGESAGKFEGRQAIVDWLAGIMDIQTDQRRHLVLNPVVQQLDETEAHVLTNLLVTAAEGVSARIATTGFYNVHLRKEEDGIWRISSMVAGFDIPF